MGKRRKRQPLEPEKVMCHVPEHTRIQLKQQQQLIKALHAEISYLKANPQKKPINAKQKLYETLQRSAPDGLRCSDLLALGYYRYTLYKYLHQLLKDGVIERYHVVRLHRESGRTCTRYRVIKELLVVA
jgi:hypothetical protein